MRLKVEWSIFDEFCAECGSNRHTGGVCDACGSNDVGLPIGFAEYVDEELQFLSGEMTKELQRARHAATGPYHQR